LINRAAVIAAIALLGVCVAGAAAQIGGTPATGNPTPGTPQPDPPNLADRVTLTGCVQRASAADAIDSNTPSSTRFVLLDATKQRVNPAGTGGSKVAAGVSSPTYRLNAIEGQLSPFVGATVEISGEILPRSSDAPGSARSDSPTLQVEFVQRIAATCR
jgi:hypothetical protein